MYRKVFILGILLLSIILLFLNLRDYLVFSHPISGAVPSIFLFIYCFLVMPLFYLYKFRKEFQSNQLISQYTTSEITNEIICDITPTYKTETDWRNVHKIEELKSWFLFYYSNDLFGFAPKRVMTANQINELRDLILTKKIKAKLLKP